MSKAKKATRVEPAATIVAYKGFSADWKCRDFQFKVGESYTHKGKISLCNSGFHACEFPLDVWNYYPPQNGNQAALVALGGASDEKEKDSKRVGQSITIKASLDIAALVSASVEWVFNKAKETGAGNVASGDSSTAASSGYSSTAASSGYSSTAASSGYYSTAASSGYYSTAASSGDSSTAASSGYYSTAASSGDSSTAASSGYSSTAASSGDSSTAASSGDSSTAACDTNGFACVAGIGGRVKGALCSALSCGYRDSEKRNRIAVAYVGENGIKPDVWYSINDAGEFQEVK